MTESVGVNQQDWASSAVPTAATESPHSLKDGDAAGTSQRELKGKTPHTGPVLNWNCVSSTKRHSSLLLKPFHGFSWVTFARHSPEDDFTVPECQIVYLNH